MKCAIMVSLPTLILMTSLQQLISSKALDRAPTAALAHKQQQRLVSQPDAGEPSDADWDQVHYIQISERFLFLQPGVVAQRRQAVQRRLGPGV